MLAALKIAVVLIVPPSLLAAHDHMALVPLYYGLVNIWFGYLFWRHRQARMTVVMAYLLSGMFLFKYLIEPLEVSALPPLPAPPPLMLAGPPDVQDRIGKGNGSRWTDWMSADAARLARDEVEDTVAERALPVIR